MRLKKEVNCTIYMSMYALSKTKTACINGSRLISVLESKTKMK